MAVTVSYNIKAIDKFTATARKINASINTITQTTKQHEKAVRDSRRAYDNMGRAATKAGNKAAAGAAKSRTAMLSSKQIGAGMYTVGRNINTHVTLPLLGAAGASIKMANDFNKNMATVATLIPGQTARVKQLKNEIQQLAIETGTSTKDLSEGAYAAISAWGDSADTIDRLRVVAQASKAGLAGTEETLSLVASMTEIYGDNSSKAAEHLTDLAFVTNKLAIKAPFSEMASSMGRVAPLAKQLNISQEELFATMTAQAGVTGSVSEVSTQIAGLYTSVIKATPRMEEIVLSANAKMGKSYATASDMIGDMGTLNFLKFIEGATSGTQDFNKALGGRKEGMVLAMSLLSSRSAKYIEAMDEMKNKSGQMKVAFKEVAEGINANGEKWERTKQRMMVMAQRIGDKLMPAFERLLDVVSPWIDKLANMDQAGIDSALAMAKLALKLGAILMVSGKILQFTSMFGGLLGTVSANAGTGAANIANMTKGAGGLGAALGKINAAAIGFSIGYSIGTAIWEVLEAKNKQRSAAREAKARAGTKVSKEAFRAAESGTMFQAGEAERRVKEKWKGHDLAKIEERISAGKTEGYGSELQGDISIMRRARKRKEMLLGKMQSGDMGMFGAGSLTGQTKDESGLKSGGGFSVPENLFGTADDRKMTLAVDINAPEGTVGKVTATGGKYANVDTGKQGR